MIIDYRDCKLHINLLTYTEDDLEWELEEDDNHHTSILDQILHEDSNVHEIDELIINEVIYQMKNAILERQLSDLELN